MAGYRQIHTQIWKDEWFINLEPLERLLFIYLFSNDLASISGIYKIPQRVIANETGIDMGSLDMMLAKFQADQKIFYKDGVLWIVNMSKFHANASPRTMARVNKDIEQIPECDVLKAYRYHANTGIYSIDTVSIPDTLSLSVSKSVSVSESKIENVSDATTTTTPIPVADDEPVGVLRPLAQAFTAATHLPEGSGGQLWVDGLQKLYAMGASPGDIEIAVGELTRKDYHIASPASIIGAVANVMRKREERKPEAGISKYLRGYADHIKH